MSADFRRRVVRTAAFAYAALLVSGCSWFSDFKRQPDFHPWQSVSDTVPPRGNPQMSVPVYGSAAPGFMYSRAQFPATIDSMANLKNPIAPDARSLENGHKYFAINCSVCHGYAGAGDGIATKYGMIPMPLTSDHAKSLSDGYIFGMIRNGRGSMPTYNRIEEPDRWDIVNYVRALQGKIPGVTVATGPIGKPGETGATLPGVTQMGPTRPAPYYHQVGSQAMVPLDSNQHGMASPDTTQTGGRP
ncbi:MAG: cytochrome c [Gemmatimonadota bacterium]|nr:cytochrome c [Gemmatimonadota bacterium]MDE3172781.1 cytochrome c [Gemmatimonadota bacterium]MDE3217618.1 cytochrome c [Gemmatimonadota bacterium]